jgi:hypothetical protein
MATARSEASRAASITASAATSRSPAHETALDELCCHDGGAQGPAVRKRMDVVKKSLEEYSDEEVYAQIESMASADLQGPAKSVGHAEFEVRVVLRHFRCLLGALPTAGR